MSDLTTDNTARRRAMGIVVAFGVVSLFGDIVYEGARGVIGPYLLTLGASAAVVGFVSGAGEFAGYALRTVTGWFADRTGGYWAMTFFGYGLTVVAVPLLGWVGRVDLALALVVAERLGKAIRSPARDALLADAAEPLGRGWGFGIHEALDQTGAVLGPLLLAAVLAMREADYRLAFTILAVPGVLALASLFVARRLIPSRHHVAPGPSVDVGGDDRSASARLYLLFVFLTAIGFAPFPLIGFHLSARGVFDAAQVPLLFAAAMAVDAVAALVSGRLYDRRGLQVLVAAPVLSVAALAAFTTAAWAVWLAMAAWGAVMGVQESTLRAAVGDLSVSARRATAYGVFNTAFGMALLIGGVTLGFLYDLSIPVLAGVVIATQVAAVMVLRRLLGSVEGAAA
ncbi:MAG TPA: MFS transporter [Acidimicrobiia bacterium]